MIEAIKDIGEIIEKRGGDFIESLVKDIKVKEGKDHYVIRINFDTKNNEVKLTEETFSKNSPNKYLYVGNPPANSPRDRVSVTGQNAQYLFTSTFPTLLRNINGGKLKDKLEIVVSRFFRDVGNGKKFFDFVNSGFCPDFPKELYGKYSKEQEKKFKKAALECLFKKIKEERGINKNEIALFTVFVNGEPVSSDPEYKRYVASSFLDERFESAQKGTCYVCGKSDVPVTDDTTQLKFKYYITDKVNFASGLNKKNFYKNFSICKDCYRKLLEGEMFVKNNLRFNLYGMTVYIIPKFIYKSNFSYPDISEWAKNIDLFVSSANALDNYIKFKEAIKEDMLFEESKNNLMLNLLLAKDDGKSLKIYGLIKDVPPSRIDEIVEKQNELDTFARNLLSDDNTWRLGFMSFLFLFPIRKKRDSFDKSLMKTYVDILEGNKISYDYLIERFTELARVLVYEQSDQYFANGNANQLHKTVLKQNLLLKYFEELKLLRKGGVMDFKGLKVDSEIADFMKNMGYDEQKAAMFLIGYLVGIVGTAQWKAGIDKKPILNKITYQGMGIKRIVPFVNELFEKLVQYKELPRSEVVFASAKSLLDKNIDNWRLSDKENVFYILSGYAFSTLKSMTSKNKNNKEESNE